MAALQRDMGQQKESSQMIRGTSIVSGLTIVSRVLGFIREILVARLFGTGIVAEAFIVALRIPNLLRSFVAEGALTSAFVPVFTGELHKGKEEAQKAIRSVSGLLLMATVFLTVLGIVFSKEIVHLYAPGFGSGTDKSLLCIRLTQIMFPYIICVSFVAMLNGALNSVKIFGAAAMAQVVMNSVLIAGAVIAGWFSPIAGVVILAGSVIVGGVVQVVIQMPSLRRAGFSIFPSRELFTPQTRQLVKLMFPAVLGATVYQITIFVSTVLASLLTVGSVAYLSYADRLTQLPIGIFTISLASVLLPTLSTATARGDESSFGAHLINALRYTSFVTIPLSAAIFYYATPLIVLMFQRGAFTAYSSVMTAQAVRAYSLGLWGISCLSMVSRAFIAKKDTKTPTVVGLVTLCISFTLSLVLMGPPREENRGAMFEAISGLQHFILRLVGSSYHLFDLGHAGLALASSISSLCGFVILSTLLRRRAPQIAWKEFLNSTLRSIGATVGMIICLSLFPGTHFGNVLTILIGTIVGIVAYVVFSRLFCSKELAETIAMVRRKVRVSEGT